MDVIRFGRPEEYLLKKLINNCQLSLGLSLIRAVITA